MNIEIKLPYEVSLALEILRKNNFEAYVVGGCVRDSLLGKIASDWDITTSALPNEIILCFEKYKTIPTGMKHGTITVVIEKMSIEITTYRIDGEYIDNRKPESVLFVDKIALDLARRDFTINAMAYNECGIIDLYNGINDIYSKKINCVGNPDKRFEEDGLRILRALRFSSVLGFEIEYNTLESIKKNKNLLKNISWERIAMEFKKLIKGVNFYDVAYKNKEVFEVFLHEISSIDFKSWDDILKNVNFMPQNETTRVVVFFYLIEKTSFGYSSGTLVESVLKRFKYDNKTKELIKVLVKNFELDIETCNISLRKFLNCLGDRVLRLLIEIKIEYYKYRCEFEEVSNLKQARIMMEEILNTKQCYMLSHLLINGNDLRDAGIVDGKQIKLLLDKVLFMVIEGHIENKKESILEYLKVSGNI